MTKLIPFNPDSTAQRKRRVYRSIVWLDDPPGIRLGPELKGIPSKGVCVGESESTAIAWWDGRYIAVASLNDRKSKELLWEKVTAILNPATALKEAAKKSSTPQ